MFSQEFLNLFCPVNIKKWNKFWRNISFILISVYCNNVSFSVLSFNVYQLKYYFSFFKYGYIHKRSKKYISFMERNGILLLARYHYLSTKPILLFTWCSKSRERLSPHANVVIDSSSQVSERSGCHHSPVLATVLRMHSISRKVFPSCVKPLPDYAT
jgi:hypothetical protein